MDKLGLSADEILKVIKEEWEKDVDDDPFAGLVRAIAKSIEANNQKIADQIQERG